MRQSVRGFTWAAMLACLLGSEGVPCAIAEDPRPPDVAPIRAPRRASRDVDLLHSAVRDPAARANPVRWHVFDRASVRAQDRQNDASPGTPLRVGINRAVPGDRIINTRTDGTWLSMPDGSRVWSLQLEVERARAVRVHFRQLSLADGTRLVVAGAPDFTPDVLRREGRKGPDGSWSTAVPGEVVYLEYQDPTGVASHPTIIIDEIAHIYRGFGEEDGLDGTVAIGECEQDVMCFNTDFDARNSVARILFNDPVVSGAFLCTGAMLVDNDPNTFAGYFLTANHCIGTAEGAASVTAYWFYQTNRCNGTVPSLSSVPRTDGAVLVATSSRFLGGTDSTLLRFIDDPSDGQTFASWTTTVPATDNAAVIGIHHPNGSHKRLSEGRTTLQNPTCGEVPRTRFIYNDWDVGQTEPGSSGSPLFNADWQIVGQLFGFCSFFGVEPGCNNQSDYNNVYGKMGVFFQQVSPILLGVAEDDAFEDNDSLEEARSVAAAQYDLRLVDFDDYFSLTVAVPSVVTADASFSTTDMDLNLELLELDGTVLKSSMTLGRSESVSATVAPGTYVIHASKDAGWGGDYSLTVGATQKGCVPPPAPVAVDGDVDKNRFISFIPGAGQENISYAVTLVTVHDPQPTNLPEFPPPDMSWLDGSVRWVGPPSSYTVSSLPSTTGFASPASCAQVAADWSGYPEVHVYGPEIAPSSTYEIRAIAEGCDPDLPSNYSDPLILTTARWGDIIAPFQDTLSESINQPDVQDIVAMVDSVKEVFGNVSRLRGQLRTTPVELRRPPSVSDIVSTADAVTGRAYLFGDISDCP